MAQMAVGVLKKYLTPERNDSFFAGPSLPLDALGAPSFNANTKKSPSRKPAPPNTMNTWRHVPRSPKAHAVITPDVISPK